MVTQGDGQVVDLEKEGDEMPDLSLLIMQAQAGNEDAMGKIISLYMPLILKYSRDKVKGIDEDCKQHLILSLIQAVKKFRFG